MKMENSSQIIKIKKVGQQTEYMTMESVTLYIVIHTYIKLGTERSLLFVSRCNNKLVGVSISFCTVSGP